jgi:hypothetical protein
MNPNSALTWLPRIEVYGLPVPRTVFVPYNHRTISAMFDGADTTELPRLIAACEDAISVIGLPAFIRTDLASAKHGGPKCYKVATIEDLASRLIETIEDNEMKFWMQRFGPRAIMVREFLDLDAAFTCFRGLPIAREWRLFADREKVLCRHPYWPDGALEGHFWHGEPAGWREALADHHAEPARMDTMQAMAIQAASAQGCGEWSVDFACDRDGKWWLIDMATMQDSYHWEGCPNGASP